MVPTVIGAWLGVAMGFTFFEGSPFMGAILFLAVAFGFFWAIEKNKDTGMGVVLLLAFLAYVIYRSISRPLSHMHAVISEIAEQADLTRRVTIEGDDELASTGRAFNSMMERFQKLVADLGRAVEQLAELLRHPNPFFNVHALADFDVSR